jgi:hypothetical protein
MAFLLIGRSFSMETAPRQWRALPARYASADSSYEHEVFGSCSAEGPWKAAGKGIFAPAATQARIADLSANDSQQ